MGVFDIIKNAAKAVVSMTTNPIRTAKDFLSAPVRLVHHIVDTANSLDEMPKAIRDVVEKYGDLHVSKILVFRESVNVLVKAGVKTLTMGKLKTPIRHVFEVFVLSSYPGTEFQYLRMEKNETVQASVLSWNEVSALEKSTEYITLTPPKTESFRKFMDNYAQNTDPKKLWIYDPVTANCQVFVYLGLRSNGFDDKTANENFIVQKEIKNEISSTTNSIMKGITTVANFGRRIVLGESQFGFDDGESNKCLAELLNCHAETVQKFFASPYMQTVMDEMDAIEQMKRKRIRE